MGSNTINTTADFASMTAAQLRAALQADGVAVPTRWNKAQLVEAMTEHHAADEVSEEDMIEAGEALTDIEQPVDLDDEEGDEPVSRNVVKPRYRQLYKERGNPNHCGDWLAAELDGLFTGSDGKFDHEAFTACLRANSVDFSGKWADLPISGQNGWVGRYRMNGRQKLERVVLATGKLFVDGIVEFAPVYWLTEKATKLPAVDCQWFFGDDGEIVYPETEEVAA